MYDVDPKVIREEVEGEEKEAAGKEGEEEAERGEIFGEICDSGICSYCREILFLTDCRKSCS